MFSLRTHWVHRHAKTSLDNERYDTIYSLITARAEKYIISLYIYNISFSLSIESKCAYVQLVLLQKYNWPSK